MFLEVFQSRKAGILCIRANKSFISFYDQICYTYLYIKCCKKQSSPKCSIKNTTSSIYNKIANIVNQIKNLNHCPPCTWKTMKIQFWYMRVLIMPSSWNRIPRELTVIHCVFHMGRCQKVSLKEFWYFSQQYLQYVQSVAFK